MFAFLFCAQNSPINAFISYHNKPFLSIAIDFTPYAFIINKHTYKYFPDFSAQAADMPEKGAHCIYKVHFL